MRGRFGFVTGGDAKINYYLRSVSTVGAFHDAVAH